MSNSNNVSVGPNATLAKVAGWVWVSYGALLGLVLLVMAAVPIPGGWVLLLVLLFGSSIFAYVGSQTVRGKAKDTLGNGIGSIVFGLFGLQAAISTLTADGDPYRAFGSLLAGLILLVAGVIALIGRSSYKRWRASLDQTKAH